MVMSTSNLAEIFIAMVDACGILSRSVGQKTGSRNIANSQHLKCKKATENGPKSPKISTV